MSWLDWTKTPNPHVEVIKVKECRTKVVIPRERVRELLEAEARKMYTGKGILDNFRAYQVGISSTDPVKEIEATLIFYDKL